MIQQVHDYIANIRRRSSDCASIDASRLNENKNDACKSVGSFMDFNQSGNSEQSDDCGLFKTKPECKFIDDKVDAATLRYLDLIFRSSTSYGKNYLIYPSFDISVDGSKEGNKTMKDCINKCDDDKLCVGLSYNINQKMCKTISDNTILTIKNLIKSSDSYGHVSFLKTKIPSDTPLISPSPTPSISIPVNLVVVNSDLYNYGSNNIIENNKVGNYKLNGFIHYYGKKSANIPELQRMANTNIKSCYETCAQNSDCTQFTYNNSNNSCVLYKEEVGINSYDVSVYNNNNFDTYIKRSLNDNLNKGQDFDNYIKFIDMDMAGQDLQSYDNTNISDCKSKCDNNTDCIGFTSANNNCYLKKFILPISRTEYKKSSNIYFLNNAVSYIKLDVINNNFIDNIKSSLLNYEDYTDGKYNSTTNEGKSQACTDDLGNFMEHAVGKNSRNAGWGFYNVICKFKEYLVSAILQKYMNMIFRSSTVYGKDFIPYPLKKITSGSLTSYSNKNLKKCIELCDPLECSGISYKIHDNTCEVYKSDNPLNITNLVDNSDWNGYISFLRRNDPPGPPLSTPTVKPLKSQEIIKTLKYVVSNSNIDNNNMSNYKLDGFFTIYGRGLNGNVIDSIGPKTNIKTCYDKCKLNSNCTGFNYNSYNYSCNLYNNISIDRTGYDNNIDAYIKSANYDTVSSLTDNRFPDFDYYVKYNNLDFYSSDLDTIKPTDTIENTKQSCNELPECIGFVYVSSANRGYLKKYIMNNDWKTFHNSYITPNNNVTSYAKSRIIDNNMDHLYNWLPGVREWSSQCVGIGNKSSACNTDSGAGSITEWDSNSNSEASIRGCNSSRETTIQCKIKNEDIAGVITRYLNTAIRGNTAYGSDFTAYASAKINSSNFNELRNTPLKDCFEKCKNDINCLGASYKISDKTCYIHNPADKRFLDVESLEKTGDNDGHISIIRIKR